MNDHSLSKILRGMRACGEAVDWVGNETDASALWQRCERGDWMLWLLTRCEVKRETLVLAACGCARLALPYVPQEEGRPLRAIETAEAWCRGEASISEVRIAAAAAADASDAAYAADAADAAADAAAAGKIWIEACDVAKQALAIGRDDEPPEIKRDWNELVSLVGAV